MKKLVFCLLAACLILSCGGSGNDMLDALWTAEKTVHIGMSKTLSTNVLHFKALETASLMAVELGENDDAEKYSAWASELKNSIKSKFYLKNKKMFSSMKTTMLDDSPVEKRDLLGESLAVISGVVEGDEASALEHRRVCFRNSGLSFRQGTDSENSLVFPEDSGKS